MLVIFGVVIAALLIMSLVMTAGWLFQRKVGNAGWSDVFWTFGTGAVLAAAALVPLEALPSPQARRILIALMASTWALRLGAHVAARVAGGPEDSRYADMREASGQRFQRAMFLLMIVQAPVSALLALAALAAAHAPGPLGAGDLAAVAIFLVAVGGEALADRQLNRFKAQAGNHGRVCDTGLWAWSRHPNYVFEWLAWFAYPAAAAPFGLARPWLWLTFVAPALMYLLLTRVSGVPPLERSMLRSRGDAFRRYQARVPCFLPLPLPRSGASR